MRRVLCFAAGRKENRFAKVRPPLAREKNEVLMNRQSTVWNDPRKYQTHPKVGFLGTVHGQATLGGSGLTAEQAHRTKCVSNERQIGLAYHMYADDNTDFYPAHDDWASVGGRIKGNKGPWPWRFADPKQVPETNRPLNLYLQAVDVFHCPADKGDSYWPQAKTCWDGWGNSYLPMWAVDWYKVKHVTGDTHAIRGSPEATPIKTSEIGRSSANKIVQGDWHWNGSRDPKDPKSVWHNYRGTRFYILLFGDGHVENYTFPKEYVNWQHGFVPDPSYKWW